MRVVRIDHGTRNPDAICSVIADSDHRISTIRFVSISVPACRRFGDGVKVSNVLVDYAWQDIEALGSVHRFAVGFMF